MGQSNRQLLAPLLIFKKDTNSSKLNISTCISLQQVVTWRFTSAGSFATTGIVESTTLSCINNIRQTLKKRWQTLCLCSTHCTRQHLTRQKPVCWVSYVGPVDKLFGLRHKKVDHVTTRRCQASRSLAWRASDPCRVSGLHKKVNPWPLDDARRPGT